MNKFFKKPVLIGLTVFLVSIYLLPSAASALTISSDDVITLTYSSSPTGQAIKKNKALADERVREILSQYDSQLAASFSHTDDKTERSSPIFGTATTSTITTLQLSQLLPSGTRLGFILGTTREKTDSAFFTNSTYYDQRAGVSLVQPLINNSFGYAQRKGVQAVKEEREAAYFQTDAAMQDLTHVHLKIYWNWIFSKGVTEIEAEALSLAKKLYATNRQKALIGLAEEGDLFAYAANVNIRQNEYLIAKSDTLLALGELVVALGLDEKSIISDADHSPKINNTPVTVFVERALKNNPELKSLQIEIRALDAKIAAAKNGKLPKLDAQASVTVNGLDPAYKQALGDMGDVNPVWQAGLSASFPLQNRASKSALKQVELLQVQKKMHYQNAENRLNKLIGVGVERIKLASERVGVTSQAIDNQKKKWADEIKKYDQGRSDTDMVLRYQNDYLMARLMHLRSRIDHQLAQLEVQRMVGELKPR